MVMTSKQLILIANGDSWTFGCEIVDPKLLKKHPKIKNLTEIDFLPENDIYRIERIWPTLLAKQLNARVINLSEPGDDNTSILNRTQEYILKLKSEGHDASEIFVVVGWTSPERRDFWYKSDDGTKSFKLKLNPHGVSSDQKPITNLAKVYACNFWHPEEYLLRYVTTVYNFENFCHQQCVNFLSFNSFYRPRDLNINDWKDIDVEQEINSLNFPRINLSDSKQSERVHYKPNYNLIWYAIDPIRFYSKGIDTSTFKTFVDKNCGTNGYNGWHPNELGHELWSKELYRYIKKNKLA
jgi:hypothetical protein